MVERNYMVAVYNLRSGRKQENPDLANIKGDNSKEIIILAGQGVCFVI